MSAFQTASNIPNSESPAVLISRFSVFASIKVDRKNLSNQKLHYFSQVQPIDFYLAFSSPEYPLTMLLKDTSCPVERLSSTVEPYAWMS